MRISIQSIHSTKIQVSYRTHLDQSPGISQRIKKLHELSCLSLKSILHVLRVEFSLCNAKYCIIWLILNETVIRKNSFAEVSKNLARYKSENIFVIDHYIELERWWQCCKKFYHSSNQFESYIIIFWCFKQNYFQICISAKPFFLYLHRKVHESIKEKPD